MNHSQKIVIKGARVHNLKNIDIEIPKNKIVIITGRSGSGKSTLAFDTVFAEGQRRYVESLSAYARQFLEQLQKPDVDSIEGLSPAIAIEQKYASRNPRSTVATITEIYDYLRVLYAKTGTPFCYSCGKEISSQTIQEMVDQVMRLPEGEKILLLAPVVKAEKGSFDRELKQLHKDGFIRVRIDGKLHDLSKPISLDKNKEHKIEAVIDRLIIKKGLEKRLADSFQTALKSGNGLAVILPFTSDEISFNEKLACVNCQISYPEISPRSFSFNSPYGACSSCSGTGIKIDEKTILKTEQGKEQPGDLFPGLCPDCGGKRLNKESLWIKTGGKSISDFTAMCIKDALEFTSALCFKGKKNAVAGPLVKEISKRLKCLCHLGLGYLTLDRIAGTLSGGEAHRINLATQLGTRLSGVLYVLDEPSVGLHSRDTDRLLQTLKDLHDLGNTILIVEHDEETIRFSDYVIDLGPGAGTEGGWVVAAGTPEKIIKSRTSITGQYLSGRKKIAVPAARRSPGNNLISIKGASENNLKNIDVSIPLGLFVCITGVSGSGKSSLVFDTLLKVLSSKKNRELSHHVRVRAIEGTALVERVINVNQASIGRTPRSNPATFTGVFFSIRDIFSRLPESKIRGYKPVRFSFNVKGGRCEACQGDGLVKIEMHFLPDIYVTCDVCQGSRYNRETMEVYYRGKNIADVLAMTVREALCFFKNIPVIAGKLQILNDVGLDYITLGQSATTFSGGEAQRIKLSKELGKKTKGHTLYILDEPTTGLHFADIEKLLEVLNLLVDKGNTVLVIEHNMEVIKTADHIIDLGPEAGNDGGYLVAAGTPEEIIKSPQSYTGKYLKKLL